MTVTTTNVYIDYVADGVTTAFPTTFEFLNIDDVAVSVNGVLIVSGYSVTGAGAEGGGTVIFDVAPASPLAIHIERIMAIVQEIDPINNSTIFGNVLARGLDTVIMIAQQTQNSVQEGISIAGPAAVTAVAAAADATAAAATAVAATANKANLAGDNLSLAQALSFRGRLNVYAIPVEAYGAVADSLITDNTTAINAAETAAAALGVAVSFKEGASYYFKGTLRGARDRLTWIGNRTRLIYNGDVDTRDLIIFGNETRVTNTYQNANPPLYYREMNVTGIEVCSRTVMTGGWAVRTPGCVRSNFGIIVQPQDFCEEMVNAGIGVARNGVCTWQGIWAQIIDNNRYYGDSLNAYTVCFAVNGYLDYTFSAVVYSGPKADCWPIYGKISQGRSVVTTDTYPAVLMGGGFGGLYLTPQTTMINNCVNFRVDLSLTAEGNRELFATGAIFDVAVGSTSGSVEINDNGVAGLKISFGNCWVSAGQGHGVWVKKHTGLFTLSGTRIIGNVGDGFRTDQVGSGFTIIDGGQITNNGGYGINGTDNNHSVSYATQMFSNTLGDVNTTYTNSGQMENGATSFRGDATLLLNKRMYFGPSSASYIGGGDAPNFYPSILWDTGDATYYDQSANAILDVIGGNVALRTLFDRIVIRDNTAIIPGSGSPEGAITANPASLYQRTDNGTIYRKGSGTGNTGWVLMS